MAFKSEMTSLPKMAFRSEFAFLPETAFLPAIAFPPEMAFGQKLPLSRKFFWAKNNLPNLKWLFG